MAKRIEIEDKYEAAFINHMKSSGTDVPSEHIKIVQFDNPFTIEVDDLETLKKVKDALQDCSKIKNKVTIGQAKEMIREIVRNHLASRK